MTKEQIKELKRFVKSEGLTQEALAEMFGVSQANINALLNGRTPFGKSVASSWEERLGVRAAWLMIGDGEMLKSAAQAAPLAATDTITMPREAWEVIRDQAASLKAKDVSLERKDKQIDEMLSMLRKQIEKGEDAGYHGHAATRAAAE